MVEKCLHDIQRGSPVDSKPSLTVVRYARLIYDQTLEGAPSPATLREREILHLSSPEADSGAARTSPGRFQR